jgi:uncharacterized iron-regulated membrane protein
MMKTKLRSLHCMLGLWAGIGLCLWLLAGSILLWQKTWQTPKAFRPEPEKPVDLAKLLASAQSHYPEPGSWRLRLPKQPGEAVQAVFLAEDLFAEAEPKVLWLHPYTAEILGETHKLPFWQGVYRLHSSFWLDERGRPAVIAAGLMLACLLVSGLLLWRKTKQNSSPTARHRSLGLMIFPPLLISLISGLLLSLPAGWLSAPANLPKAKIEPASTLEQVIQKLHALYPDSRLREIAIPQNVDEPWEVAIHLSSTLDIDPAWLRLVLHPDGRLEERPAGLRQWVYALHTGEVAGLPGKLMLMLGGVGFVLQTVYGFKLWRQRARLKATALRARGNKHQVA